MEAAGVGLDIVFKIGRVLRFRNEIDSPETPDSLKRPGEPPNRPQKFGAAIGERRPHPRPGEAVRILSSRTAKSSGFLVSTAVAFGGDVTPTAGTGRPRTAYSWPGRLLTPCLTEKGASFSREWQIHCRQKSCAVFVRYPRDYLLLYQNDLTGRCHESFNWTTGIRLELSQ